jgi:hypothetical protein
VIFTGNSWDAQIMDERQSIQYAWKRWGVHGREAWGKRLGIPLRKCENNIKVDLKGLEWEGVDWINLLQDRGQ